MSILKALIGGLIGAVVATVVLMVLRDGTMRGYEWFPLVTGLLTGLGVRLLTGSAGRSLLTGIVAALVSMAAILSGDELLFILKNRDVNLGPSEQIAQKEAAAKLAMASADAEDSEGSEDEDAASDEEMSADTDGAQSREAAARSAIGSVDGTAPLPPKKRPKSMKDFLPYIFSGLGVLIAYVLGQGTPPAKVVAHEEPTSPAEPEEDAAT